MSEVVARALVVMLSALLGFGLLYGVGFAYVLVAAGLNLADYSSAGHGVIASGIIGWCVVAYQWLEKRRAR